MKRRKLPYPKLHIWLLADLVLLAAYLVLRQNRGLMNALTKRLTAPLRAALGRLCYRTPISVMEVLIVLAVVVAVVYIVLAAIYLVRSREGCGRRVYGAALLPLCVVLLVYNVFCLLWGANDWADGFQEQSGIYAQPVAEEDLAAVTEYFAHQLWDVYDAVERDENGLFAVSRVEILEKSSRIYEGAEALFPFLEFEDVGVKAMAFSRVMSIIDFTGVYCSCTGESNVNVDSPACMLPATVAHELTHQRGIASEQECNFLGVVASVSSGDVAYAYSGWLDGYVQLGNALYRVAPDRYWQIRNALPAQVQADLQYNNAYWKQFTGTVIQKASNKVYDGVLKAYGDERGMQSYGTAVDLLVAYYKDNI